MIQPHNRHMSFSVYICVLSVADTVSLIIGRYEAYQREVELGGVFNCSMFLHKRVQ